MLPDDKVIPKHIVPIIEAWKVCSKVPTALLPTKILRKKMTNIKKVAPTDDKQEIDAQSELPLIIKLPIPTPISVIIHKGMNINVST